MDRLYRVLIVTVCIAGTLLLAGCGGGSGGGLSSLFGDSFSSDSGDSGIVLASSDLGSAAHATQPEPATMALLGSGLVAYAIFKRKGKK